MSSGPRAREKSGAGCWLAGILLCVGAVLAIAWDSEALLVGVALGASIGIVVLLLPPRGASERAVAELETALGGRLPERYREFLRRRGRDEDGPLRGSDCFLRHVLENNEYLPELLRENDLELELPERYVCFFMHCGYMAAWFDLDAPGQDPPCWWLSEGQEPVLRQVESFSACMRHHVGGYDENWNPLRRDHS